ncbi:MAG: efflux RND transporter periplasmic adaptor subunit [Bacteroidales bacterium]
MRSALIMICFMTMVLFSCKQNNAGFQRGNMVKDYAVIALVPKSVTVHNDFPATIEGQRVIEIRPMISGYLQEILVNEGDHVKKGQLLFKINNPQYAEDVITAKARINSAVADVNSARIEIEKIRPLVEKEIVSKYRLQSAELTLQAKEAALEEDRAALKNAETNLNYTYIKSPQDGIIGTIPYKNGALVGNNNPEALTTLSDISEVFAYFSWNEKQVLDMLFDSTGATVEEKLKNIPPATLILANSTEYKEKGRVEMASGLISTGTGSATFKAVFKNPSGILRSGSSATVRIPSVKNKSLIVPQSATYELQDKRFIFTVGNDNKVKAVSITSTPSDDGHYFLIIEGLKPGDRVVIDGISSLKDGDTIVPKETDPESFYKNII